MGLTGGRTIIQPVCFLHRPLPTPHTIDFNGFQWLQQTWKGQWWDLGMGWSIKVYYFALKLARRRVLTAISKRHFIMRYLNIKKKSYPTDVPSPKSPNKPSGFCRYEGASGPNRIAINVMEKRLQLPLQEPIKSADGQTFQKRSNQLFTIESSAISGSLIALQNHQREIPKENLY